MKAKIVSVISNPNKAIRDTVVSKKYHADLLELRFDLLFSHITDSLKLLHFIKSIKKTTKLPVIGTIRLKPEGGKYSGSENKRLDIFTHIIPELDYVDIELRSKIAIDVSNLAKKNHKHLIVSYHNFLRTPYIPSLRRIITKSNILHPYIIKIATFINKPQDFLNLTSILTSKKHNKYGISIIPMSAKNSFISLRILAKFLNSSLLYFSASDSVAPGQLSIKQYLELTK